MIARYPGSNPGGSTLFTRKLEIDQTLYGQQMAKLPGRPNQGKTESIGARTVDVYLPTKELVEEWKEAARKADLSLSRFVIEVVERYRRSDTSAIEPAWKVEERAKALETELEELGRRYDILCRAFAQQEKQLQQFSHALERASKSSIDPHMVRRIIRIFRHRPEESIPALTILEKLFIKESDGDSIAKVRQSLNLLQDIHLIKSAGTMEWRWCFGKPSIRKGKYIPGAKRRRLLRLRARRQA